MLHDKKGLRLDMNSTFMFGEDRFGDAEDFVIHNIKNSWSYTCRNCGVSSSLFLSLDLVFV